MKKDNTNNNIFKKRKTEVLPDKYDIFSVLGEEYFRNAANEFYSDDY